MTTMNLGDYQAAVEFDDEAGLFHGEIVNLRDVVTFQGRSVEELRRAFADSVADYLAFCAERHEDPEIPADALLSVKVDPGLHRAGLSVARRSGVTPDEWVSQALDRASS